MRFPETYGRELVREVVAQEEAQGSNVRAFSYRIVGDDSYGGAPWLTLQF